MESTVIGITRKSPLSMKKMEKKEEVEAKEGKSVGSSQGRVHVHCGGLEKRSYPSSSILPVWNDSEIKV